MSTGSLKWNLRAYYKKFLFALTVPLQQGDRLIFSECLKVELEIVHLTVDNFKVNHYYSESTECAHPILTNVLALMCNVQPYLEVYFQALRSVPNLSIVTSLWAVYCLTSRRDSSAPTSVDLFGTCDLAAPEQTGLTPSSCVHT